MFYSLEKRPGIKAENPSFGVGKLAQRLAQHWRTMSREEREPFEILARKDKERYVVELKAYKKGTYMGGGRRAADCKPIILPQAGGESSGLDPSGPELGGGESEEPGSPELDQLCELYQ